MPAIHILPREVYSLIAAGEVVERPSSVVKELLENAVDAGAKRITLEIRAGGVRFLRITDDGCGISRVDVPKAFISHATSKIRCESDLDAIATLGFRGEALASVAAVARVEMLTRPEGAELGTRYVIECGEEKLCDDAGCPQGTTIIVRDLFCNTPARMKFLRKDVTEGNYVADTVTKIALSHPEISFRFIRDEKEALLTPGNGSLNDTVLSLFGRAFAEGLTECNYELGGITISGLITKPLFGRPNRNMQYLFVNHRYVRIPAVAAALDEAYKNSIMVGKFPGAVLFFEIAPGTVDVNVHPAKTEIRFSNDKAVFESVYYAVKSALARGDTRPHLQMPVQRAVPAARPVRGDQLSFRKQTEAAWGSPVQKKEASPVMPAAAPAATTERFAPTPAAIRAVAPSLRDAGVPQAPRQTIFPVEAPTAVTAQESAPPAPEPATEPIPMAEPSPLVVTAEKKAPELRLLGEVFNTYILAEYGDKLLICDKHAAHERILFEKLRKNANPGNAQMLLSPVRVALSGREYNAVLDSLALFQAAGYLIEDFGNMAVLVRGTPVELAEADVASLVAELAGELAKGKLSMMPEKLDWLYHSAACRAAVKAGDSISPEAQLSILQQVLADDAIRYCPHGRPVLTELSRHELEKQFGRLG